jgi:hemoglobin-like flavoprotein
MSFDPQLIRDSFDLIVDREPELARKFYELFFARYPIVRQMFGRHSQAQQEKMLTQALVMVVAHVDDEKWLVQTLSGLGERHVAYGVSDEMYDWVGECLLATLAHAAGPAWSLALDDAWSEAYNAIASLMKSGARAVESDAA